MIYLLSPKSNKETMHLPMIEFSLLEGKKDYLSYDVLMFTSKQAVLSAEALMPYWKRIPCIAIGDATAEIISSLGGKVMHQPKDFYAKNLNQDILKHFKTKKILYLRPKKVSFDSQTFLKNKGMDIEEHILYETRCIHYHPTDKPLCNAIIIFTSPSTIECFFKNFEWDMSYVAVVIGEATRAHLPTYVHAYIADIPRVTSCISKAKELNTSQ